MKNKIKYDNSQLLNFAKDSYLERTSRPIYAIVFLLPFIIFYELGTIFINTDILNHSQVRVVAFVWLQKFLENLGFGSKFVWMAPALLVIIILVSLQLTSRKRWNFWLSDIWLMAIECVLLAIPLIVFSLFLNSSNNLQSKFTGSSIMHTQLKVLSTPATTSDTPVAEIEEENATGNIVKGSTLADIVTGIGAGIYEELVFRLILIIALMILFQNILGFEHKTSIIFSIVISATLFSVHHHVDFLSGQLNPSDPFNLKIFSFRALAGIYFAILFAIRGFGITAGAHAFYDIIATLINVVFFE